MARRRVAVEAFLGSCATLLWLAREAVHAVGLQWDFRVYMAAARAARVGLDPYVGANLAHVMGRAEALPFLYPPIALLPFLALTHLAPSLAADAWIILKVGVLFGLVGWWWRDYVPGPGPLIVTLLAIVGANAAAVADLRAGNVGLVEAGLLWVGFGAWMRGRTTLFAALVVLAAIFKLAPAVFLLLLLVPMPGQPARPRTFGVALAALAGLVLGPFVIGPAAHWRPALLTGPFPVGEANPSAFALALSLLRGRVARPELVSGAVWLAWCAGVGVASLPALRRLRAAGDRAGLVAAAVGLDLLLSPRPMAYGFVLGGGALAWLVWQGGRTWIERAGLTLLVCAQGFFTLAQEPWTGTLATHATLFASAAVWFLWVFRAPAPGVQSGTPNFAPERRNR